MAAFTVKAQEENGGFGKSSKKPEAKGRFIGWGQCTEGLYPVAFNEETRRLRGVQTSSLKYRESAAKTAAARLRAPFLTVGFLHSRPPAPSLDPADRGGKKACRIENHDFAIVMLN